MSSNSEAPSSDEPQLHATEEEVDEELCLLDLEDADSLLEHAQDLVAQHFDEFPEDTVDDDAARYAAEMTKASITDGTRNGHLRIIKHYITFHLRRDLKWDAKCVDEQTPKDITAFITKKCGPTDKGFEGKKYSTAVSTRAALTMWYRSLRPNESTAEWRLDPVTNTWRGLPTRSRDVSQFMVGLEKTKAKSGEVSSSARALSLEDMHRLYDHCLKPSLSLAERRAGTVRYVAYLLAWLMMLRIDEVVSLKFENIDKIPGERKFLQVSLNTRKQSQTGVLHSWRLWANDSDPKICPMRAFILLASLYGPSIKKAGPLFLRISAPGAVMQSQPVTASILSRALSKDLQNLGYGSWALFGTHSFRRGECQYRLKVKRWSAGEVAAWGGWSQVEAVTMYRYFFSPNDNHERMNEYDKN
ncbi:hypothetical protein FB45DRAFT_1079705 [Roridomyces roridus]|uniref:Tyr recombinase domain-containing protein n=1 Tax=Roridomyces roridus TaxID=1738132 RepID=A0AAD7BRK4_9AGAR|nr:hypothetical protein FB45DRAFT_1079705 [Roridomyces roridus]